MPTVTILAADLSSNLMSRVYILAKLLEPEFTVHIVGPGNLENLWEPLRADSTLHYRPYTARSALELFVQRRSVAKRLISGDLIYVCKPVNASFRLGLYARRLLARPLLLDIEEWEAGLIGDSVYWEARLLKGRWLSDVNSPLYTRLLERRIASADGITVSNSFLQQRYGGMWLPHCRAPEQFAGGAVPPKGAPVVLFCGSVRAHKGVDLLVRAWERVRHPTAKLKIIGLRPDDPLARSVSAGDAGRFEFVGPVRLADVPGELARATVIVVPQRSDRASQGQLPTRLIDAMAAGRTVVSTRVADIPRWLDGGAGIVVEPDCVESLAAGIQLALDHPQESQSMARRARERFLRYGSFPANRPQVFRLIHDLIAGRRPAPPPPAFADESSQASLQAAV